MIFIFYNAFLATCVIMEKGAGLHLATACSWDNQNDGKKEIVTTSSAIFFKAY